MSDQYVGKGYWGKMIDVDLTTGTIDINDSHMQYVADWVGGEALGARLVWEAEEKNPGFDPMSDDNPVMFIPGPCTGTPVPFASRYQVCNKSAVTQPWVNPYDHPVGGVGWAACGGHFGPNLKWTGFDLVRIKGHSATPVMLKVEDNHAELIDATECWGLDIPGTQEWAKGKYGVQFATSLIGPAAEHGVRWGGIHSDTGRAAARGGAAAVLGHRKFKGIIAFGTQMTPVADPKLVAELRRSYYNALWEWDGLEAFRRWGTWYESTFNNLTGEMATKNHQYCETPNHITAGLPYYASGRYFARHRTCIGCVTRCMKFGIVREGKYKGTIYEGPDYEGAIMNGHNWLIKTGEEMAYLGEYIESQGMDCITTGGTVAFLIEAVEKGYLKTEQIDDIKLDWGATDEIHKLLEHLIYDHTNPIYDHMRGGIMPMIRWMKENNDIPYETSHAISAQTKNNCFAAWRATQVESAHHIPGYSICPRGACHMSGKTGDHHGGLAALGNSGVFCFFGSQGGVSGFAYFEMFNAVMGRNLSDEQWQIMGGRATVMEKCINAVNGFRGHDDIPGGRMFDPCPDFFDDGTPVLNPGRVVSRELWQEEMDKWYTEKNVDPKTSCPRLGCLREYGMEFVIPTLEKALALTGDKLID